MAPLARPLHQKRVSATDSISEGPTEACSSAIFAGRYATCGRLGFAEKTIMEIRGHKTASVFPRYNVVDEADLAEGAAALAESARQKCHNCNPMRRKMLESNELREGA